MVIQTLPVAKLLPADYNPRKDLKPGDPEYEKLAEWLTGTGDRPRIEGLTDEALDRALMFYQAHGSIPAALATAGLRMNSRRLMLIRGTPVDRTGGRRRAAPAARRGGRRG